MAIGLQRKGWHESKADRKGKRNAEPESRVGWRWRGEREREE